MEYIAEIIAPIKLIGGKSLEVNQDIEVSLDCPVCQRSARNIVFSSKQDKGFCIYTNHKFDGKLIDFIVDKRGDVYNITFRLMYSYIKFFDEIRKAPSVPHPTWARVRYRTVCSGCGEINEVSTQNNLSRPINRTCSCGNILTVEDSEIPRFKLYDIEENLLYERQESNTAIYIYSQEVPPIVEKTFLEIIGGTTDDFYQKIANEQPVYYQANYHINDPVDFSRNLEKMIFCLIQNEVKFDATGNGRSIKESFLERYRRKA